MTAQGSSRRDSAMSKKGSTRTEIKGIDPQVAEAGSYFTIIGAGGDLQEWVDGVEKMLVEEGIGKPVAWYWTYGACVNTYAQPERWQDAFQDDLVFLLFPLDGLDVGRLAIFKVKFEARWFDDIVANMR